MSNIKSEIAAFAIGLIAQKSFSSFSYDDISREFGMTKAAVHYHFKSKEDLGVAICELLRDKLLSAREQELDAARKGRHPWQYLEARFKSLGPGGICPIVSMQADFENLPERLRAALAEATRVEIENLSLLAQAYDKDVDLDRLTMLLLSIKGALQYRRVMGEGFFRKMVKSVKAQFYSVIPLRS